MADRIRLVLLFLVLLAVGAFLGSAIAEWTARRPSGETAAAPPRPHRRIRVEVLNAAGTEGLARRATDHLRELGFDVVYFGNAERFGRDSSSVVDRVRRLESARLVADALGIRTVTSRPDSNLYLDVTVLLGKDWELPSPPPEAPGAERPWWDLRALWERIVAPDSASAGRGRMVDPSP